MAELARPAKQETKCGDKRGSSSAKPGIISWSGCHFSSGPHESRITRAVPAARPLPAIAVHQLAFRSVAVLII